MTNFSCVVNILLDHKMRDSAGRVRTVMRRPAAVSARACADSDGPAAVSARACADSDGAAAVSARACADSDEAAVSAGTVRAAGLPLLQRCGADEGRGWKIDAAEPEQVLHTQKTSPSDGPSAGNTPAPARGQPRRI